MHSFETKDKNSRKKLKSLLLLKANFLSEFHYFTDFFAHFRSVAIVTLNMNEMTSYRNMSRRVPCRNNGDIIVALNTLAGVYDLSVGFSNRLLQLLFPFTRKFSEYEIFPSE